MAPPRRPSNRCVYAEHGRRCTRNGTGNPVLCRAHRMVLEEDAARAHARPHTEPAFVGVIRDLLHGRTPNRERVAEAAIEGVGIFFAARARAAGPIPGQQFPPGFPPFPFGGNPPGRDHRAQDIPYPGPPPARRTLVEAREVMGFAPSEIVDEGILKKRYRELARKYHPDLGTPAEREYRQQQMARINAANDEIAKSLG